MSLKICLNCHFETGAKLFCWLIICIVKLDFTCLFCIVELWNRFNCSHAFEVDLTRIGHIKCFLLMDGIVHFWCFKIWMLRTFKTGQFLISNGHRQCFLNQDNINWIENCQNMFDRHSLFYWKYAPDLLLIMSTMS